MSPLASHFVMLLGIAKTWATNNLPGWSDDSHRDLLALHGARRIDGRYSARQMTVQQLASVLADYERRGWPRQKKPVPPAIAHIVRLWGKLGEAGKIDNASRPALLVWCARQLGHEVPDLDGLEAAESQKLIEALKGWQRR